MGAVGRWAITYVFMMEFMNASHQRVAGAFVNSTAAISLMAAAFTFSWLTKYTAYFEDFTIVWSTLLLLIAVCFLPESPKFLYSHKRFKEARSELSYVAKVNGTMLSNFSFDTECASDDRQPLLEKERSIDNYGAVGESTEP